MDKHFLASRQKGVTLVELLVAILIGLLSIYAVYRVYDGSERAKRNIASVSDAQISGLYSIFLLEQSIHNAGSGLMWNTANDTTNAVNLGICPADTALPAKGATGATLASLSLRPLPVVIQRDDDNDEIFIFSGNSAYHLDSISVTGIDDDIVTVGSVLGADSFRQGGALIAVSGAGATTTCSPFQVVANSVAGVAEGTTDVRLTPTPAAPFAVGTRLVDIGVPTRRHFYVNGNGILQMAEWQLLPDGTWQSRVEPIISNVIRFRAQYGINNNTIPGIDQWTVAETAWSADNVLAAPVRNLAAPASTQITAIQAIRIAIIVQADEPDPNATQPTNITFFSDCANVTCVSDGGGTGGIATGTLPAERRYRLYETVIPLKNTVWNP